MKTKLVTPIQDAFLLEKRAIIETIFEPIKKHIIILYLVSNTLENRSQINPFPITCFSDLILFTISQRTVHLRVKK